MMMMENHKMRAPGKFRFSHNRIHGGFKHQDSELLYNSEKKIMKFKNPVPNSSMDSRAKTYSRTNCDSDCNGTVTLTFDSHWNASANAMSDSDKFHLLQWAKTARRGRRSLSKSTPTSTSASTLSYSSNEKQIVPFTSENKAVDTESSLSDQDSEDHGDSSTNFSESSDEKKVEPSLSGEKEAVNTQFPFTHHDSEDRKVSSVNYPEVEQLSGEKKAVDTPLPLAVRYPGDHRVFAMNFPEKDRVAEFPDLKRKRETEDTKNIARIETNNCRKEIIFDILKERNLKSTHKQNFHSCDNCGKTFNCHQALGGHKSSYNSNFPKGEVGESSLQGSMRKTNNKIDANSGAHQCKSCGMRFAIGQALGGHQGIHRSGQVKPRMRSWLSLSPTNDIMRKEAVSRYLASSSVQEAQDQVTNKKRKVMLFGCNLAESLPERMDEAIELF